MFQQFKWILGSVVLAVIGVILFQILWLKQNYELSKDYFQQQVDVALNQSMNHYFAKRTASRKALITQEFPGSSVIEYSSIQVEDSLDVVLENSFGKNASVVIKVQEEGNIDSIMSYSKEMRNFSGKGFGKYVEQLIPRLMGELLDETIDTNALDSLFNQELKNQGLDLTGRVFVNPSDSLLSSGLFANTSRVSISNKTSVGAVVEDYQMFIFREMWISIVGSILLIVLLFISFYRMLTVIFKQKKMSQVKNDFINNMTHEFKTPLASIYAANEALLNFGALEDRSKAVKYISMAQREVDRLTGMVQRILNASVNEQNDVSLSLKIVGVEGMLSGMMERHRMSTEKTIHYSYTQKGGNSIEADEEHLYHILNNLIDNAIKYSAEIVDIQIGFVQQNEDFELYVRDKGKGIKKEYLTKIFDQFYRVPTGDRHDVKGFGLGLSYVKKMVELHGWSIHLKSELGRGSEFTITNKK